MDHTKDIGKTAAAMNEISEARDPKPSPGSASVRVFAPATVGNVACGYDVLGLALETPGDVVTAILSPHPGVRIVDITGDGGKIPREAHRNTAGLAVQALLQTVGEGASPDGGIELRLEKSLPLAGGMGGSAASAVAAVVAVDALLELGAAPHLLLRCAGQGEAGGAGAPHLDNVVPALLGGICLTLPPPPESHEESRGDRREDGRDSRPTFNSDDPESGLPTVVPLPVPSGLSVALVHPEIEVPTREARRILADSVPLSTAIAQWGNTAGFVAALYQGDLELLARATVDHVAEPFRASLVPGFFQVKAAALEAGGLAASLSGAGPSVFALCPDLETARQVAEAMVQAFRSAGNVPARGYASPVAKEGAHLLPSSHS